MAKFDDEKVVFQNVNVPNHTTRVDAEKYNAMKSAFLKIIAGFSA